jgi:membrane protease YdiL (CAAX protease family)
MTSTEETAEATGPTPTGPSRKEWLVSLGTLALGAAIVAYLIPFNRRTIVADEYILVNAAALLFVPFLAIFSLFREGTEAFGFAVQRNGAGRLALLFFVLMIPVVYVASRYPDFQRTYPLRYGAAYSWSSLVYHEVTYGFYLFCWEFFYRGFLTFGLKRAFGPVAAVVLQSLAFGLMHYGKPTPEFLSSFVGGAVLGWLALRGKSFYPCFILHWAVSILMDVLAIHSRSHGLF